MGTMQDVQPKEFSDGTTSQRPGMPPEKERALVYILQDAKEFIDNNTDFNSVLSAELQTMIDRVKEIETDILPTESGNNDGECLDHIIELFGLEVL